MGFFGLLDMLRLAVERYGLLLLHVGLDDIDIQIDMDGLTGGYADIGSHAVCLILEIQLLEMFQHSLPIFLNPQHVDLTKFEHDQQDILGLAEIRPDFKANKRHNDDKDNQLNDSYDDLIDEHDAEVVLEGLVEFYLGRVDHVVVTGDQVIVDHREVVTRSIYGEFRQTHNAGNDDMVDLYLIVAESFVESTVLVRRVKLWLIEHRIEEGLNGKWF